jgi:hypothetical protein
MHRREAATHTDLSIVQTSPTVSWVIEVQAHVTYLLRASSRVTPSSVAVHTRCNGGTKFSCQ